jgi:hypothetical protein
MSKSKTAKFSKYKGVHRTASNKFQAMIWYDNKNHGLGSFNTEKEAAKRYNKEALKIFGNFAALNIIKD